MFEPDEYIFTKFAHFFKRRSKNKQADLSQAVRLTEIKSRLVIFARAITGKPIEIFEAEREGGYKNNNFFLPSVVTEFPTPEENSSFYLFRILYLSVQKTLNLNWTDNLDHAIEESRLNAAQTSDKVLKELFIQFPVTKGYFDKYVAYFEGKAKTHER